MASLKEVGKKKLIMYFLTLSQDILTSLTVRDILRDILKILGNSKWTVIERYYRTSLPV